MRQVIGCICILAIFALVARGQDAGKPKAAVFPLGGSSAQELRDRIGFSIRTKLDRDGAYDPIDGPAMADMAEIAKEGVNFDTPPATVKDLASDSGARVLIWGDVNRGNGGDWVRLKLLDLRKKDSPPREYEGEIRNPTDVRFVVEKFLETLPGVQSFTHPNEEGVHHDAMSDALFRSNPNLVIDGDFLEAGHWEALYEAEKYPVAVSDEPPGVDKVVIYDLPALGSEGAHRVLAMNLSFDDATNNGLACLSDAIEISPGVRYRVSFRYRSDGPSTHVFVKGYTTGKNLAGEIEDREVYRLQVPPGAATGNRWQSVEADLNPQNPAYPVQRLRVDLYAYLAQGHVMFDRVEMKAIGRESKAGTRP